MINLKHLSHQSASTSENLVICKNNLNIHIQKILISYRFINSKKEGLRKILKFNKNMMKEAKPQYT